MWTCRRQVAVLSVMQMRQLLVETVLVVLYTTAITQYVQLRNVRVQYVVDLIQKARCADQNVAAQRLAYVHALSIRAVQMLFVQNVSRIMQWMLRYGVGLSGLVRWKLVLREVQLPQSYKATVAALSWGCPAVKMIIVKTIVVLIAVIDIASQMYVGRHVDVHKWAAKNLVG